MTFSHVTLALDLSLSQPGFAILAITDDGHPNVKDRGQPIILEKSFVKTRQAAKHGEKLTQIQAEIRRYFDSYKPEHVVREKSFSRFAASTQAIYKVNGICDLTAYEYGHKAIDEIAATSVKKLVTGNGKASKECVMASVIERMRIEQADYFANDDESDAVAVGLAYYIREGLIV